MTLARAKSTLSAPDFEVMRRVNRWRAPRWVRWWMLLATRAGDGWLWAMAGIAVLLSSDPERFHAMEAAGLAVSAGIVIFHKIKRVFCRRRPCDIEPHCWGQLATRHNKRGNSAMRDTFSFPSGHSTTAFAVALALGSFYPEIRPVLLILAANVAISRVIIGMHFVSDVLVGSGIGALLGYAAFRFAV